VTPTVPMGRVSAVPIRVGLSWLVVMPLVGVALFAGIEVERGALVARVVVASVGTIALFTSVLAHEVGHAAVAVRVGVRPRRIVLFLFGGYTEMEIDDARPSDDVAVSLAGSVVSAGLAMASWGMSVVLPEAAGLAGVARQLALVNAGMAIFNLLPGFPLDGGRITRALLVSRGRGRRQAEAITAWFGIAIGAMLVGAGAAGHAAGRPSFLVAVPVGVVVAVLAWAARPVDRRTAVDVMHPAPPAVSESAAIASVDGSAGAVPVVSSGGVVGLVTGRSGDGLVAGAMNAVLPGDVVPERMPLAEVAELIRRAGRTLVVVGDDGTVVGMISPTDLPADLHQVSEET